MQGPKRDGWLIEHFICSVRRKAEGRTGQIQALLRISTVSTARSQQSCFIHVFAQTLKWQICLQRLLTFWPHAYFVSSESRVLRLIPCFSHYFPLLRHCDMNDCLSGIRSINWIQRNVIHYSLQASRCSGFCKLNSFIMLISLFCQMHHFHLSGVETSSEWIWLRQWGNGWHSMRWEMWKHISMVSGMWQSQLGGPWSQKKSTMQIVSF